MPELIVAAAASPIVIGVVTHIVRRASHHVARINQNTAAIVLIQERMASNDRTAETRHMETRETLAEIKTAVRDVQQHLLRR